MKADSIIIGNLYEVKAGRNVTVVKVKSVNNKTGCWICETTKGKKMNIADADRFVGDVTPGKEAKAEKTSEKKPSLKEVIKSKVVAIIPKGRRATSTMRDLDDPTFTRKHHVRNGVLVLEADDEQPKHLGPKPKGRMSALSAAHRVLKEAGKPLGVREILETALAKNYCNIDGRTPFNTINGGIRKEIKHKGEASRFVWAGPGLFAAR
ncbi:MAG TPA: hypothetical protein DEB39_12070 [Planctomycetaceae bacterium]|nr:hypothetical protein [Planctomycetaceae bacterium]